MKKRSTIDRGELSAKLSRGEPPDGSFFSEGWGGVAGKGGDEPDRPFRKGTDSPIEGSVEREGMRVRIPRRVGSEGGSGSRQADAGQVWNGANVEPEVWIQGPSRLKEAWNVEQNSSPSRSSIPAIENGVSLSE